MGIFAEVLSRPIKVKKRPAPSAPSKTQQRIDRAAKLVASEAAKKGYKPDLVNAIWNRATEFYLARDENTYGVKPQLVDTKTRWTPADLDRLYEELNVTGDMRRLGQFLEFLRRDGTLTGITHTLTAGLLRQPVQFSGAPALVEELRGADAIYDDEGYVAKPPKDAEFWRIFKESELTAIMFDGFHGGVGLGEFVDANGGYKGKTRALRRLPIHGLQYDFTTERFTYQSRYGGPWEVNPGDGRWFLFTPWGECRPWQFGRWWPCALPVVSKLGSTLNRQRWQNAMADALKYIKASAANDPDRLDELERFGNEAWFQNAFIVLEHDEEVGAVEISGTGHEAFTKGEDQSDKQIIRAIAGQDVTTQGGSGWSDGNAWLDIFSDVVGTLAEALATTVHDQGLATWTTEIRGYPIEYTPWARWDTRSSKRKAADVEALGTFATNVKLIVEVFETETDKVDVHALAEQHGIIVPMIKVEKEDAKPEKAQSFAYDQENGILTINQRLAELGLPPDTTERGNMTVPEYKAMLESKKAAEGSDAAAPVVQPDESAGNV